MLVTGASRGIGRAIATRLAAAGADIGMLQRGAADETVAAVRALGRRAVVGRVDLSDPGSAEDAVARVVDELGHLDGCVSNAGMIHRQPALDVSLDEWTRVVMVNLVSCFAVARAGARTMLQRGSPLASIVLTASVLAVQGGINVSSYAASKAGVANLARALANEWGPQGIRVNAVAPGYIENEQTRPIWDDPVRKSEIDSRIPMRRWGADREVAGAVAFLLSEEASYVNGHTLVVDGGWLAR